MKFVPSWAVKAPCKVNGVECPERKPGCRDSCQRFAEYQQKLSEFKKNMFSRKRADEIADGFITDTKIKLTSGKKYER